MRVVAVTVWVLVAVMVFRPTYLGGKAGYTLVSGDSMVPTFHSGDLILTRARDTYQHGDVIAYRIHLRNGSRGATVIHRIVGGSPKHGFATQGDNRDAVDTWHPKPGDIIGAAQVRVPAGGKVVGRLKGPLGLAFLAGSMFLMFMWPTRKANAAVADPPSRSAFSRINRSAMNR